MHALHFTDRLVHLELVVLDAKEELDGDLLDEDVANPLVKLGALEFFGVEVDGPVEGVEPGEDVITVQEEYGLPLKVVGEIVLNGLAEFL